MKEHRAAVHAAAILADGKAIATGGADRMIRLWDGLTLKDHVEPVTGLAFTEDGKGLLSADRDGNLQLRKLTPRPR